ncbi:hypothetical protein SNEBB_010621 [Seison nebaliae]|nr:hypothetical protein SNEBB_010621 [Seison nebaliae]
MLDIQLKLKKIEFIKVQQFIPIFNMNGIAIPGIILFITIYESLKIFAFHVDMRYKDEITYRFYIQTELIPELFFNVIILTNCNFRTLATTWDEYHLSHKSKLDGNNRPSSKHKNGASKAYMYRAEICEPDEDEGEVYVNITLGYSNTVVETLVTGLGCEIDEVWKYCDMIWEVGIYPNLKPAKKKKTTRAWKYFGKKKLNIEILPLPRVTIKPIPYTIIRKTTIPMLIDTTAKPDKILVDEVHHTSSHPIQQSHLLILFNVGFILHNSITSEILNYSISNVLKNVFKANVIRKMDIQRFLDGSNYLINLKFSIEQKKQEFNKFLTYYNKNQTDDIEKAKEEVEQLVNWKRFQGIMTRLIEIHLKVNLLELNITKVMVFGTTSMITSDINKDQFNIQIIYIPLIVVVILVISIIVICICRKRSIEPKIKLNGIRNSVDSFKRKNAQKDTQQSDSYVLPIWKDSEEADEDINRKNAHELEKLLSNFYPKD